MTIEEFASRLLDRIGVLRHPSDLDLLIFFARHPRSLLASENLAAFLGYSTSQMAASLDLLVDAGLITRTQSERHAARMFVLAAHSPDRGWFPDLLKAAATREGRLALLGALRRRVDPRPRPVLVEREPDGNQRTRTG